MLAAVAAPPSVATAELGELLSLGDLPSGRALGIELRSTSAKAAPVNVLDGTLHDELFTMQYTLSEDPVEALRSIGQTLEQILDKFSWSGVVGISITKEIARRLGVHSDDFSTLEKDVGALLAQVLDGKSSFICTVVHCDAAGYSELVWGTRASRDRWAHKTVIMCTLGKHIGAVMFSDGHRVRHLPMKSLAPLPGKSKSPYGRFEPPEPGSPEFAFWTDAIDEFLAEVLEVVPHVDEVVILPTGRTAAGLDLSRTLLPALRRAGATAALKTCSISASAQSPCSVVRGVALCALRELETSQVFGLLEPLLLGDRALHMLSEAQLRVLFDKLLNKLDDSGTGKVPVKKLQEPLRSLGLHLELHHLKAEIGDEDDPDVVSFDGFMRWWLREVTHARVVRVTSADAFRGLLESTPPEGYGDLIVLEVTNAYDRQCRRFEKSFHLLADDYPTIRFVQLIANATVGASEYCKKELAVKTAPAFFVFRRGFGGVVAQWTGASVERFVTQLNEAIALGAG